MYQYERRRLHQAVALIYGLIGVGLLSYLTLMLKTYPLFDWATNDLVWVREWLYMTCMDYEGAALCLVVCKSLVIMIIVIIIFVRPVSHSSPSKIAL